MSTTKFVVNYIVFGVLGLVAGAVVMWGFLRVFEFLWGLA